MKILVYLLFSFSLLFSENIDKSFFDNSNENLEKIYVLRLQNNAKILKNALGAEEKEQLKYQNILLNKLLDLTKGEKEENFVKFKDIDIMKDYIINIKQYMGILSLKENIEQNIKQNLEKAKLLENKISGYTNEKEIKVTNSQLLYANCMLENKKYKQIIQNIEKVKETYKKLFLENLQKTKFSVNGSTLKKISQISEDLRKKTLRQDKESLSSDNMRLKDKISNIAKERQVDLDNLFYAKLEIIIPLLQNRDIKYFQEIKELQTFANDNKLNDFEKVFDLFKYLSREHVGITKSTLQDTKESFMDIVKYSWMQTNKPLIPLGDGVSVLDIVKFLFIFILGFLVAAFFRKKISLSAKYAKNASSSTRLILSNLVYYFFIFITFIVALKSIGLNLSSLTVLVGALSVGIGFGLQNVVSNFISGIILIFEKSIQLGDIIEVESGTLGKVSQINMRSSVITTFDNIDIIIPNSTLIQNNVTNFTFADDERRLHVPFGVSYGTDAKYVMNIILDELEKSELEYIKFNMDKKPKIWMVGMNASSVDFELLVWVDVKINKFKKESSYKSDFLIFIYETLNKHKIEIPFPQMDIHIKK